VASHGLSPEEAQASTYELGQGIPGWVVQRGQPVLLVDATIDDRHRPVPGAETAVRGLGCVPLVTTQGIIGAMLIGAEAVGAFGPEHMDTLTCLATTTVEDVDRSRLYHLAITDPLTTAYNRQYLLEALPTEIRRHRRYRRPLSILMVDADHFRDINLTHGRVVGDAAIKSLGELVIISVREVDSVVRYGGEQFLVILPETALQEATTMAERLRASVAATPVETPVGDQAFTVSIGVAELHSPDESMTGLILRADRALQTAKQHGRNRVAQAD
jgi:diguanylate cyclase (GGDEF)-like protein